MVRLPAATANSPKHGQPGQTSGENGVKTPCMWAVNTPVRKRSRKKETRGGGKVKKALHAPRGRFGGGGDDLKRKKWVGLLAGVDGYGQTGAGIRVESTNRAGQAHTFAPDRPDRSAGIAALSTSASSEIHLGCFF
jgi:hypothetical protein